MNAIKKGLRRPILKIAAFLLLFTLLDHAIGAALAYFIYAEKPDMHALVWTDLYNRRENSVDVLFLGSSHARFAFDTKTLDSKLGAKTFNLSSSDQTPVVGYFALKEALRHQSPKVLVYEAYWRKFGTADNTTPAYFVYDYIRGADVKLEMLASMSGDRNFVPFLEEALSKTYKYRDHFMPIMRSLVHGKVNENRYYDLKTVQAPVDYGDSRYLGRGYFSSDAVVTPDTLRRDNSFQTAQFSWDAKQIAYFEKTVRLCKSRGIRMLVVTAPLPRQSIAYTKDYDAYSARIAQLCKNDGLTYLDYNQPNRDGQLFQNRDFMDTNHLNQHGAAKFDALLADPVKRCLRP